MGPPAAPSSRPTAANSSSRAPLGAVACSSARSSSDSTPRAPRDARLRRRAARRSAAALRWFAEADAVTPRLGWHNASPAGGSPTRSRRCSRSAGRRSRTSPRCLGGRAHARARTGPRACLALPRSRRGSAGRVVEAAVLLEDAAAQHDASRRFLRAGPCAACARGRPRRGARSAPPARRSRPPSPLRASSAPRRGSRKRAELGRIGGRTRERRPDPGRAPRRSARRRGSHEP